MADKIWKYRRFWSEIFSATVLAKEALLCLVYATLIFQYTQTNWTLQIAITYKSQTNQLIVKF